MKSVSDKSKFCEARMCLVCSKFKMKPMWLVCSEHGGRGECKEIGCEGEQDA